MIKKLTAIVFTAVFFTGLQAATQAQDAWALDLSAKDCPIQFSGDITAKIDETSCFRETTSDNRGYIYFNNTEWSDHNNFAQFVFIPIKSYQYWTKAPTSKKEDIHHWDTLTGVKLNKVVSVSCKGFDCYSFEAPEDESGHCLWFFKNARQGDKTSDVSQATGIFTGYTCDNAKQSIFDADEAMDFIKKVSTQ